MTIPPQRGRVGTLKVSKRAERWEILPELASRRLKFWRLVRLGLRPVLPCHHEHDDLRPYRRADGIS